jgi:hypothetical protein
MALLSYYHQKDLILFTNPSTHNKNEIKGNTPIKNSSNIKIFSFDQKNLLEEIEANKEIIKEENGEDGDDDKGNNSKNSEKENSDGSDSEPSLDNFENDELVKLLPNVPKKKSKI